MSDPYREPGTPWACPRCSEPLLASDGPRPCRADCGEWWPIELLRELELDRELDSEAVARSSFAYVPGRCVTCGKPMEACSWSNTLLAQCPGHGVWLEARFRAAFHVVIDDWVEREREVRELADRLGEADDAGRRELARRLLALERRLAKLERRGDGG